VSLTTYYSRILAQRKAGSPTMQEARRDYGDALGRLFPMIYS